MQEEILRTLKNCTTSELQYRLGNLNESMETMKRTQQIIREILKEREEKEKAEKHEEYIGRCFRRISDTDKMRDGTTPAEMFQIVRILEAPNSDHAECIAINSHIHKTCWSESNIVRCVLPLWVPTQKFITDNMPVFIDMYEEIQAEEFQQAILQTYKKIIETNG